MHDFYDIIELMKITLYETDLGLIKLISEDNYLLQLDLNPKDSSKSEISEFNDFVMNQLNEYFEGKRTSFDIPLKLTSQSKINELVWNELVKIPYADTVSYKDIAQRINNPKAYRAVGTAVGKNPIPIIVPCHRVIAANGKLGGFSLGIEVKKILLKIEQKDGLKKVF